jgi:hypothetical protein
MGLAAGFFAYLVILLLMVWKSDRVGIDWFLTGRGKRAGDDSHPMLRGERGEGGPEPLM